MRFHAALITTLAAALLAAPPARAQYHHPVRHYNRQGRAYFRGPLHVALGGGTALYNGDLGNAPADNFLGFAGSLGVRYRLTPHLHLGGELAYAALGARDQLRERGLAFTGSNGTGTVFFRLDLLPDESVFAASVAGPPAVQVFVQAGAGLLLYGPQAYRGAERPTAGTLILPPERNDYPALGGVAPVGGGLSVRLTDQLRTELAAAYYFTTTDQLDDISNQRLGGASASNDGFGTVLLKFDYAIK